jgi:dTDP-4-dehydrorhamnose reductase
MMRPSLLVIVRVSWIFSEFGHNFVRTMLKLAQSRSSVTVVSDQVGCPTYAPALAQTLIEIARQVAAQNFTAWGTYHLGRSWAYKPGGDGTQDF